LTLDSNPWYVQPVQEPWFAVHASSCAKGEQKKSYRDLSSRNCNPVMFSGVSSLLFWCHKMIFVFCDLEFVINNLDPQNQSGFETAIFDQRLPRSSCERSSTLKMCAFNGYRSAQLSQSSKFADTNVGLVWVPIYFENDKLVAHSKLVDHIVRFWGHRFSLAWQARCVLHDTSQKHKPMDSDLVRAVEWHIFFVR
jgi:hypothetical protein